MAVGRHSFIAFFPSDWAAGTYRMTRLVRSVYFDICLYNWDRNQPVPRAELKLMLADLEGQGERIVDMLVEAGNLTRNRGGSVCSPRALQEANRAFKLWESKSRGGRKSASRQLEESSKTPAIEPEPDSVSKLTGASAPIDPVKQLFDLGVSLLTAAGKTDKEARSLIGKWRKQRNDDAAVAAAFVECRTKAISEPIEWLTKRLEKPLYVSKSGYEYKGTLEQIAKEAQRRSDNDTYWAVQVALKNQSRDSGAGKTTAKGKK